MVSFADGAGFPNRRPIFEREARRSGLFESVNVHHFATLPAEFRTAHGDFMRTAGRGFGYYIWKPMVMLTALRSLERQDDVLMYLDAGFTVNSSGDRRFGEYLEITLDHSDRMLSFSNIFTEAHWTKADLSAHLGVDLNACIQKSSQLGSGMIFMTRTDSNIDLLQKWADVAVAANYHFSDDSISALPEHPDFREHRHDQSISSLLRKDRGTAITHYEVQDYAGRFEASKEQLPAWATRIRDAS